MRFVKNTFKLLSLGALLVVLSAGFRLLGLRSGEKNGLVNRANADVPPGCGGSEGAGSEGAGSACFWGEGCTGEGAGGDDS